jgi:hypothetical protein
MTLAFMDIVLNFLYFYNLKSHSNPGPRLRDKWRDLGICCFSSFVMDWQDAYDGWSKGILQQSLFSWENSSGADEASLLFISKDFLHFA